VLAETDELRHLQLLLGDLLLTSLKGRAAALVAQSLPSAADLKRQQH
jgi:hypothetical protein